MQRHLTMRKFREATADVDDNAIIAVTDNDGTQWSAWDVWTLELPAQTAVLIAFED